MSFTGAFPSPSSRSESSRRLVRFDSTTTSSARHNADRFRTTWTYQRISRPERSTRVSRALSSTVAHTERHSYPTDRQHWCEGYAKDDLYISQTTGKNSRSCSWTKYREYRIVGTHCTKRTSFRQDQSK
jgi:hypothetical protein